MRWLLLGGLLLTACSDASGEPLLRAELGAKSCKGTRGVSRVIPSDGYVEFALYELDPIDGGYSAWLERGSEITHAFDFNSSSDKFAVGSVRLDGDLSTYDRAVVMLGEDRCAEGRLVESTLE